MRILKRMLDFIASRMLMVTVACALLIISFYLAMNTANIWVLIDDGLDARASVVLMGEDAGKLTSYFRPEFIAQDPVLQVGTSDTSPYRDYEIRGYDHRVKMVSVWSWPWENVARAEVVESIPAIDGTIRSAKREAALAEGGDERAKDIFRTIGAYLAHTVPLYEMTYDIRHLIVLGRVASGVGGELIVGECCRILQEEYPALAQKVQVMLPDEKFDPTMDVSTGAAVIFGATGGVMEAALRTAADTLTGKSLDSIDYEEVRGTDGIKEAVYNVAGMDVKVAVASGLSNANEILKKVKNGEADYHFIEIMCCPGGCVNGGGMPIQPSSVRNFVDIRKERAKVLYEEDKNLPLRKSHDNPVVKKCYAEYLGEPGSHKAHEILHTTYTPRPKMK